ncbi:hypothetical protein HDU97_002804 [Phlyctochytrium planicorne]|nr:hypothetical protein HDU97_002804 [Phlyctochytrium planicorne]
MPHEDLSLVSFVSDYVRAIIADDSTRKLLESDLAEGRPHVADSFASVVMIDIAGYSKITSELSAFGKVSSELITMSVCDYMSKLIEVVVHFGGDVVKFLGDAIIVAFRQETTSNKSGAIARAIQCCIFIQKHHPCLIINPSSLIQVTNGLSAIPTNTARSSIISSASRQRAASVSAEVESKRSVSVTVPSNLRLKLHIAVTSGTISNIILGDPNDRLDYVLCGDCFILLEDLLNKASEGQVAVDKESWNHFQKITRQNFKKGFVKDVGSGYVIDSQVVDEFFSIRETDANTYKSSEYSTVTTIANGDTGTIVLEESWKVLENHMVLLKKFMNSSIVQMQSSLRRGPTMKRKIDQSFMGQYRSISVVFVKLKCDFDLRIADAALKAFLEAIRDNEGVFQQFSACHGLKAGLLGNFLLKGYTSGTDVWYIEGFNLVQDELVSRKKSVRKKSGNSEPDPSTKAEAASSDYNPSTHGKCFGYKQERQQINDLLTKWKVEQKTCAILIEGPSGIGKSTLLKSLTSDIDVEKCHLCITRIAKESNLVPFSGMKHILDFMIGDDIRGQFLLPQTGRNMSGFSIATASPYASASNSIALDGIFDMENGGRRMSVPRSSRSSALSTQVKDHSDALKAFLIRMDESPDFSPLLASLFQTSNCIVEPDVIRNIPAASKNSILVSLLVRIVTKWASRRRVIFVVDDLQWCDSLSLDVFAQLSFSKKDVGLVGVRPVFMLFTCRPIKELDMSGLRVLLASKNLTHIVLNGLQKDDVEDIILAAFDEKNVTHIKEEVITLLFDKTASSPLVLQTILDVIVRNRMLVIDSNGVVDFDERKRLELSAILEKKLEHAIIMQFDRLNPDFQNLLRYASVFGQYFYLEDVCTVIFNRQRGDEKGNKYFDVGSVEELLKHFQNLIEEEDVFAYIVNGETKSVNSTAPDAHENASRTSMDNNGTNDQFPPKLTQFYFRHISISLAIYDSLSYSEKGDIHTLVGEIIEFRLEESNKGSMLPLLYRNFWLTPIVSKKLKYAEELGLYFEEYGFHKEATMVLSELLVFFDSLPDVPFEFQGKERQARWCSCLAAAASSEGKFAIVLQSALRTAELCGIPFPTPATCTKRDVRTRMLKQLGYLATTNLGLNIRRPKKVVPLKNNLEFNREVAKLPPQTVKSFQMVKALTSLYYFMVPIHAIPSNFKLCTVLEILNNAITVRNIEPAVWAGATVVGGYFFLLGNPLLKKIYIDACRKATARSIEAKLTWMLRFYMVVLSALPDESELDAVCQRVLPPLTHFGDIVNVQTVSIYMLMLRHPTSFDEPKALLLEKLEEILISNSFIAHSSMTYILQYAITTKEMDVIHMMVKMLETYKAK